MEGRKPAECCHRDPKRKVNTASPQETEGAHAVSGSWDVMAACSVPAAAELWGEGRVKRQKTVVRRGVVHTLCGQLNTAVTHRCALAPAHSQLARQLLP